MPYPVFRTMFAGAGGRRVFYLHPWEIDPDQPRVEAAGMRAQWRHRINLARVEQRLIKLLRDFSWGRMDAAFPEVAA